MIQNGSSAKACKLGSVLVLVPLLNLNDSETFESMVLRSYIFPANMCLPINPSSMKTRHLSLYKQAGRTSSTCYLLLGPTLVPPPHTPTIDRHPWQAASFKSSNSTGNRSWTSSMYTPKNLRWTALGHSPATIDELYCTSANRTREYQAEKQSECQQNVGSTTTKIAGSHPNLLQPEPLGPLQQISSHVCTVVTVKLLHSFGRCINWKAHYNTYIQIPFMKRPTICKPFDPHWICPPLWSATSRTYELRAWTSNQRHWLVH